MLRPAADLAQDQVHSAASLSIGHGNLFRGQENKELFFPKTVKFFPTPADLPVVKEGWACKGVTGVKGGAFKRSQRDFLLTLFNNNGGPKIRERDAQIKMAATFQDKDQKGKNGSGIRRKKMAVFFGLDDLDGPGLGQTTLLTSLVWERGGEVSVGFSGLFGAFWSG